MKQYHLCLSGTPPMPTYLVQLWASCSGKLQFEAQRNTVRKRDDAMAVSHAAGGGGDLRPVQQLASTILSYHITLDQHCSPAPHCHP